MLAMIRNPVLPGFHADPSFCRVGEDYYIATSTFEWFPGVQIYHSRDLINWKLVSRPLNRPSQLDMRGNPDSCGVWAPCLSHADGKFWLVYTNVRRLAGAFKDAHNYIVTCDTIDGDWSDPIYVHSHGFDPSLFHDDDGTKWVTVVQWNHRSKGTGCNPTNDRFDGILLQQWDPEKGLIGDPVNIFAGSNRGLTEAPHLFKRGGYYYLTTAEGGTGYGHAVTLARARSISGPYELHPQSHVMCAEDAPDHPIQRTGHGQYVETPDGQIYHSFLMSRPLTGRFSPMGREAGLERCVWGEDDWLYLEQGGLLVRQELPGLCPVEEQNDWSTDTRFEEGKLPSEFQWLRSPYPERLFRLEKGALVLTGRESLGSWFEQSLVARRQQHFQYRAETALTFNPESYQHGAGLVCYYNRFKFHALMVTHESDLGPCLTIISCNGDYPEGQLTFPLETVVGIPNGPIELAVEVKDAEQQFFYKSDGQWQPIGPLLDASVISDEGGPGEHSSFTGAFVGMAAFDVSGHGHEARYTRFKYHPL